MNDTPIASTSRATQNRSSFAQEGLSSRDEWNKFKNALGERDFKENEKAAKIWGKRNFKLIINKLLNDERSAIYSYTKMAKSINYVLRKDAGYETLNMFDANRDYAEQLKEVNKEIRAIDSALDEVKTEKTMYVYRRVTEEQFFKEQVRVGTLRNGLEINQEIVKEIKEKFIDINHTYKDPAFVSTSLSLDPAGAKALFYNRPIVLRIRIPSGSHALFLTKKISEFASKQSNQNEVLIARDSSFQYKDLSVIKIDGFETLHVNVDLVKQEKR